MWTAKNRGRYDRSKLRYPSDLTDDEWTHVEPWIPPAKRGGNKRHVEVREVMNGIMYILSTGCQWRAIPKDLPPRSTLFDYLNLWSYDGTLDRIHHELYVACREQDGREASPTAAKRFTGPIEPKSVAFFVVHWVRRIGPAGLITRCHRHRIQAKPRRCSLAAPLGAAPFSRKRFDRGS